MHGSTGIDMAYVAAGILGAAIGFGDHIWDHAAGVALVRTAGGVVTDLAGDPWTSTSRSSVAAAPGARTHHGDHRWSRVAGGVPLMSLATRVAPCLDVDAGRVVKGVNFANLRDAGIRWSWRRPTTPRAPTN